MNKERIVAIRVDEEEFQRLKVLAGKEKVAAFVLGSAFRVKRYMGDDTSYVGWDVLERRRDLGIKIGRDPVPYGMKSPVILYPEDDAYGQYAD